MQSDKLQVERQPNSRARTFAKPNVHCKTFSTISTSQCSAKPLLALTFLIAYTQGLCIGLRIPNGASEEVHARHQTQGSRGDPR